jgi:hypothetical protein
VAGVSDYRHQIVNRIPEDLGDHAEDDDYNGPEPVPGVCTELMMGPHRPVTNGSGQVSN